MAGFSGVAGFFGEGFAGFEGAAMFGSEAIFFDGFLMFRGAVADVVFEIVFRVLARQFNHVIVAGDFGDDRSGGNFADFVVGFDEGVGVACERGAGEEVLGAVDDDLGEGDAEGFSFFYGEIGGAA